MQSCADDMRMTCYQHDMPSSQGADDTSSTWGADDIVSAQGADDMFCFCLIYLFGLIEFTCYVVSVEIAS